MDSAGIKKRVIDSSTYKAFCPAQLPFASGAADVLETGVCWSSLEQLACQAKPGKLLIFRGLPVFPVSTRGMCIFLRITSRLLHSARFESSPPAPGHREELSYQAGGLASRRDSSPNR